MLSIRCAGPPFALNGGHASANADLRVWLPYGRERRSSLTRTVGGRTVVRGRLRDLGSRHSISGATLQLAAQNVDGGDWYLAGVARTNRKGRFKGVLPPGPTRRVGVLYSVVISPAPVYSKRLLVRASGRVYLKTTTRGRTVLFQGRVSGGPIPAGGLLAVSTGATTGHEPSALSCENLPDVWSSDCDKDLAWRRPPTVLCHARP